MAQLRVPIDKLSRELAQAVAAARAGDEVLLEEKGEIVARVVGTPERTDWRAFLRELETIPPLNADFSDKVLDAVNENNRPVEDVPWAS